MNMDHGLAFKIYAIVIADRIMSSGKNWQLKEEQARRIAEAAIDATALFIQVVNEHEQAEFVSVASVMTQPLVGEGPIQRKAEEPPKSDD